MLTGSGGEAKWWIIPVENIDQIEIIKGASSALYGSSAMNGVINVRSGWPSSKPETKVIGYSGIYGNPARKSNQWWGGEKTIRCFPVIKYYILKNLEISMFVASVNFLSDNDYREDVFTKNIGGSFLKPGIAAKKHEGLSYGGVNGYFFASLGFEFLNLERQRFCLFPGHIDNAKKPIHIPLLTLSLSIIKEIIVTRLKEEFFIPIMT